MTDYGRSLIRTIVPLLVGSLVAWLATRDIDVDQALILPAADAIITAVYYGVVRFVETKVAKAGWLLGVPGAPSYAPVASVAPPGFLTASSDAPAPQ